MNSCKACSHLLDCADQPFSGKKIVINEGLMQDLTEHSDRANVNEMLLCGFDRLELEKSVK